MIEIFAPPPPIMVGLNEHELVQISLAIFCTLILIFVDTILRILVEVRNFNIATNRPCTVANTLLAIIWRGWGYVEINGKKHRFLVSNKLRADMTKKLVKSYPWLFVLSFILLTLPDVEFIFLGRLDTFLSTGMYLIPIVIELASCVENIIELELIESSWFKRAIGLIQQLIAFIKSVKEAIK
jgi:hypothetical protein